MLTAKNHKWTKLPNWPLYVIDFIKFSGKILLIKKVPTKFPLKVLLDRNCLFFEYWYHLHVSLKVCKIKQNLLSIVKDEHFDVFWLVLT